MEISRPNGSLLSGNQHIWDTSEGQWMPQAVRWRDPRHFQFDRTDPEQIMLRGDHGLEALKPLSWIVHRAKTKSGLTIRGGIARAAAWAYLFKSFTLQDWAIFVEAYGQPLRLGKYGPDASGDDKDILLQAVSSIGADYSAIVPASMTIDFVKADIAGSHELYEKRADWLDRQVSKLVLGQTATTDAIAGGHAVGRVHDRVREDIEKSDARQLASTLSRDLAAVVVALNHGPRRKYPRITIGRPDEVDVTAQVRNIATLLPHGLEVGMASVRDMLHIPEPAADEKLLGAAGRAAASKSALPPSDPVAAKTTMGTGMVAMKIAAPDSIEAAIADMFGDGGWEPLVSPLIDTVRQRLETAATPDEARLAIVDSVSAMDQGALVELLANAAFAAWLAGATGESL